MKKKHQSIETKTATERDDKAVDINKTFVESGLSPGFYRDAKLSGFYLKVTSAGKKVYLVKKKPKGESTVATVTIGAHGQGLSTKQARDEAEFLIAEKFRKGINPNLEKKQAEIKDRELAIIQAAKQAELSLLEEKNGLTLRTVFESYAGIGEWKKQTEFGKPSTEYINRRIFGKHMTDYLDKPMLNISVVDVKEKLLDIAKQSKGSAGNVGRVWNTLYNYAIDDLELQCLNPVKKAFGKKKKRGVRKQLALNPRSTIIKDHELPAWHKAVREIKNETVRDYFEFLYFLGPRADAGANQKWEDVDLKSKIITIRNAKTDSSYLLPIAPQMLAMLTRRQLIAKSQYVFPGHQFGRPIRDCRPYPAQIKKVCGVAFGPHMLRKTFGTAAAGLFPDYIVKRLMDHHVKSDVTQTHYVFAEIEELRPLMSQLENRLLQKLKPAKVIDLKERNRKTK